MYWAVADALPEWFANHKYWTDKDNKGKINTEMFREYTPEQREAHGWKKIDASMARAGDIVVTGSHAGVYVCTDDQCRVWGLANNGVPTTADKFGSPSGYEDYNTGGYNFSKKGSPLFFRPVDP